MGEGFDMLGAQYNQEVSICVRLCVGRGYWYMGRF